MQKGRERGEETKVGGDDREDCRREGKEEKKRRLEETIGRIEEGKGMRRRNEGGRRREGGLKKGKECGEGMKEGGDERED